MQTFQVRLRKKLKRGNNRFTMLFVHFKDVATHVIKVFAVLTAAILTFTLGVRSNARHTESSVRNTLI